MNLKSFLDGLSKEKYLVYFMLGWAGVFFFWAITSMYYRATNFDDAYDGIMILAKLFDLGAGITLALISLKLLIPNFLNGVKREPLVPYFLLLWAGGFFFGAIADFAWYAQYGFGGAIDVPDILGSLSALAAGVALALFAWKLLQSTTGIGQKLEQPISQTV
jgi:hypothetical protein